MARIFVGMYNFGRSSTDFYAMPPFYESFLNGLKDAGNQVLCFSHKTFGRNFYEEMPKDIYERLYSFNPDLCILFCNNFWDISKLVDCPIVIYDVDSPLVFANKDNLRENVSRYHFIVNQSKGKEVIKDTFGAIDSQISYIPFFSEIVHDESVKFVHNISFLGTNWLWKGYNFLNSFPSKYPSGDDREIAKIILEKFTEYPFRTAKEISNDLRLHPHEVFDFGSLNRASIEISGLRRIRYLCAVADLGLEIRGRYWQAECMNYFPELLLAYNPTETLTLEQTSYFYNSSRIVLNTKHIQAQNGFSFRVCDIMASNACLVTEQCSDLKTLFPKINIPTFTTPSEAREQCIKLLNNENLRREIVEACNEAIEQRFRFRHVLMQLEDITNITLRDSSRIGTLEHFSDEEPKQQKTIITSNQGIIHKIINYSTRKYPTKYYKIGKLKILKVIQVNNNEKHIYSGIIPLISITKGSSIHFLPFVLFKKFIKNLKENVFLKKNQDIITVSYIKKRIHKIRLKHKLRKQQKISICLFASRITDWQFDNLYRILEESKIFTPYIVVKPFMSQGHDAMVEFMETTYESLKNRGYKVYKGYDQKTDTFMNVRKELDPDVVFYTMYWKPHFHENFYIDKFKDKFSFFTSYAYDCARHDACMNFPLNNCVDGYFMPTTIHKKLAEQCMDNHGKNVIIAGSPKLDKFFDKNYKPIDVWKQQEHRKKRIIWAPHHSDHFPKWQYQCNSFYELCDAMLRIADKYKDEIQIAFKPHPMLKEKLINLWGKETALEYYDAWNELPNGQLENGEFFDLFLTSDAMILDSLSFIAEYTAVNKPQLFIIGEKSRVYLNEFGMKNFEVLYHAQGDLPTEICRFIEDVVIEGNDYKREARESFIRQYLMPPNGKTSAQNIYDSICKVIFGDSRNI